MIRTLALPLAAAVSALIPAGTPAAAPAAAPAAIAQASASGTLWVGPQALSVTVAVSGARSGVPHPCVHNSGPDPVAIANYSITDARHTLYAHDRLLGRGGTYCWAKGHVTLPARLYVMAVDQNNGRGGKLTLTIRPLGSPAHHKPKPRHHHKRHLQPVRYTSVVVGVQAAVGVTRDGKWGPITDAAVNRLRHAAHNHYGVRPHAVAAFQQAVGVAADGRWGPITDDQWMLARNAAGWRY
jgi:hypothetical protein